MKILKKDDGGGACADFHSCHLPRKAHRFFSSYQVPSGINTAPPTAAVHVLVSKRPCSLHRPRLVSAISGGGGAIPLPPTHAHQHLLLLVTAVPHPSQQGGPGSEPDGYETEP